MNFGYKKFRSAESQFDYKVAPTSYKWRYNPYKDASFTPVKPWIYDQFCGVPCHSIFFSDRLEATHTLWETKRQL